MFWPNDVEAFLRTRLNSILAGNLTRCGINARYWIDIVPSNALVFVMAQFIGCCLGSRLMTARDRGGNFQLLAEQHRRFHRF